MFDRIVITAANAAQARGYRAQTHGDARVAVYPDPGGRRVGSLGATVNALRRLGAAGRGRGTVLVCHSGGDARRTPGYAAMGKAFIPLKDGRPLFAHLVETMGRLRLPAAGGVLVICGDVRLDFDYGAADFSQPGVTGVAYPDGPEEARRHGVYVAKGANPAAVTDFLQKPDVRKGRHLIDTGVMFIDWPTAEKMTRLPVAGDIYEEFPKLLLGGFAPFHVNVMPSCSFFHVGSTREILEKLGDGRTYVDAVGCPLELAGGNVVTNVPAGRFEKLALGEGECFTCLPLAGGGWYDLRYRLGDDFKTDGLWERHGMAEKMRRIDYRRLLATRAAKAAEPSDGLVRVERPLRIDLAGGWSDTPPICNECGGAVLNAAVTLEGCRPVVAEVRRIAAREVRVESVDLGETGVLRTQREITGPKDAHDWCALVKSALAVTGYRFAQGGLSIRIFADVPKGSGMGTSSILGAALVEALLRAAGRPAGADEVAALTLELEREMGTGGGWQDQAGALYPGVKLVTSRPGERQALTVRRLPAKAERAFARLLADRGVLYFTGQKRMARNVLRGVLSFYRANPDGIAQAIVATLKRDATRAFAALRRGDWCAFAAVLNAYWMNKKALDPGSTNAQVESIVARIAPWTDAVTLAGAGGGGFLFALAKSRTAKARMMRVLESAGNGGRCYRFALDA